MRKILFILLVLYLVLLVININSVPVFVGDERPYSMSIQTIMSGHIDNNNHPLLAKSIVAAIVYFSYLLYGVDYPIFWRIGSILASLGSLVFLYKICRLRFKPKLSLLAVILLGTDPMFFSFSRILNLDIIALSFSLASLYYLLLFSQKGGLRNIFLWAFLMGMSLAAKFNLIFILPAIPVIIYCLKPRINVLILSGASYLSILGGLIVGNAVFFIFPQQNNWTNFFQYLIAIIRSLITMPMVTSGYLTSPSWSWFTIPQIMTFYRVFSHNQISTVAVLQNPLLFVLTLPTVCITIYLLIIRRPKKPLFTCIILVYLLGQYLPWLINFRPTYYYYIVSLTPLIILLIIQLISLLPPHLLNKTIIIIGVISVTFFLLYYPVLIGLKIPHKYEDSLFLYNRYQYPSVNRLFCQHCSPR